LVEEPRTLEEAYDHPDANHKSKWHKAISKEFNADYKEILRAMKFVLDTKLFCLKMKPKDDAKNEVWY
jgi:hypothetical protein